MHKLSTALVKEYGAIFIGNVNASALAKTRMAKSVLDAGWSMFRTMLQYKSDHAGVWFDEVDERYSTQTCSCCNRRTGPKGREGLGIREWAFPEWGAYHHRDINAAVNILAAGRRRLAEGIPVLSALGAAAEGGGRGGRQQESPSCPQQRPVGGVYAAEGSGGGSSLVLPLSFLGGDTPRDLYQLVHTVHKSQQSTSPTFLTPEQ